MSFNIEEVFSSIQSFLSSGYVLLGVLLLLAMGALKQIIGLLITGGIAFAIWFLFQDSVVEAFNSISSNFPQMVDYLFSLFGM